MAQSYNHKKIEEKWNKIWKESNSEVVDVNKNDNKYYCIDMFPYPSGEGLHVGHWRGFVMSDFYTRHAKLLGKNVLHPIGFDSFGLPAENAAIKHKTHPDKFTKDSITNFTKQLKQMGALFDWSKEITTSSPEYYRWTQWLFLQLYKHGFAEKRKSLVNWCPKDQTVLANEQVINGCCERCGTTVTKKELNQWYFLTTKLAEELLSGLDNVDWPERVKNLQKNWIGKSVGAEIRFDVQRPGVKRFILLHGRGGSPQDDFFPWLKGLLEKHGYEVLVPSLPNTDNPDDKEQTEFVASHCKIDESTIIVGHSFGGIVAQRLLEQGHKANGLILVATPYTGNFIDGKKRPTVKKALEKGYNFGIIKKNTTFVVAIADGHDDIIDPNELKSYAEQLDGHFIKVKANKPHFNDLKEEAIISACISSINVFTTRPDTLFGVNAIVLAPEHPKAKELAEKGGKLQEFNKYYKEVSSKTNIDRQQGKESDKTAVNLNITAKHPLTNEEVPVWVADYVLMDYGTGAVMSVPAHDERDFMFANAHKLPIKQVVSEQLTQSYEPGMYRPEMPTVTKDGVIVFVKHWNKDKYIGLRWTEVNWGTLLTGSIDEGDTPEETVLKEIREETGFINVDITKKLGVVDGLFYHVPKKVNKLVHGHVYIVELKDGQKVKVTDEENLKHKVEWLTQKELSKFLTADTHKFALKWLSNGYVPATGVGSLINSDIYSGQPSQEATDRIVADIESAGLGKFITTYRLRDWLVSRQRYWGPPIPIVYDPKGKPHPIKDEHLPLKLPNDVDFLPGGESPLTRSNEYIELAEKLYGKGWRFDTDTLDTFVDSSWYFLRYLTPNDSKNAFDKKIAGKWLPVDLYIGGIEHATLHLLYARFIYKFLENNKYLETTGGEPFKKLFNIGMITLHGSKMSKSKGNIVSPDPLIEHYGTDALRGYEMFVGPLDMDAEWSSRGINGVHRFLIKIHQISQKLSAASSPEEIFNNFLVKANSMIADYRLNTLIAEYMKFLNAVEKTGINKEVFGKFLITLSPIFPYITEDLWQNIGNDESIFKQSWPVQKKANSKKTIPVLVNQKFVTTITDPGSEDELSKVIKGNSKISAKISGKKYKVVYKPGSVANIVV